MVYNGARKKRKGCEEMIKSLPKLLVILCGIILLIGCSGDIAMPYDDTNERYGDWYIHRTLLDDGLLFREGSRRDLRRGQGVSPYQVWDFSHPPLSASDFLGNVIDIVGFRDGYLYTLSHAPAVMLSNDIHWHHAISQLDLGAWTIDYYIYGSAALLFGRIDFAHHLVFDHENNMTILYYVESSEEPNGMIRNAVRRYHWALDDDEILWIPGMHRNHDIHSPRRVFIAHSEEYMLINYIDGNTYVLGYIRYFVRGGLSMQFTEVLRYEFAVDDNGLMTGRIPIYAMGDSQGFYFQVITLDNEMLDFGRESAVYFFCFQVREYWHVLDLQDRVTYINGSGGVLVYSYHSVDSPRASTGRIAFLDTLETVVIPHVTPVNGIVSAYIGAEQIFVISANDIMIYTISTGAWEYLSLNELTPGQRTNAHFYDGQFGWLRFDEGHVTFYRAWQ